MAATVRLSYFNGAGPAAGVTAEGGVIKYNREETLSGTSAPIPRPVATGTAFSWHKVFALEVTGTAATSISNRKLNMTGAASTGLNVWYIDSGDVYTRSTAVAAVDAGTNGATPAGYTAMPTVATLFDAGSDVTSGTGRSGDYFMVAIGVDNLYVGGAGTAITLPDLVVTYDEA